MAAPSPDDPSKMIAKKVYYLACAFCRWTSRDIGLPDQSVASGGWPEQVLFMSILTLSSKKGIFIRKIVMLKGYLLFKNITGLLPSVKNSKRKVDDF